MRTKKIFTTVTLIALLINQANGIFSAPYKAFAANITSAQVLNHTREDTPTLNESKLEDFVIIDGVLRKYTGNASIVNIPDGVKVIGKEAFRIPNSWESSYTGAPDYLMEVHLPKSIWMIDSHAFQNCKNLTKITGTENVTEIGDLAFAHCGIQKIELPNVKKIGESAFSSSNIEEISLPMVESLGSGAFSYSKLKKLSGLGKVNKIGKDCFRNCPFVTDKKLSAKSPYRVVQKLPNGKENVFFIANGILFETGGRCSGNLVIPDGVTAIETRIRGSFSSVTIPDGVKKIGEFAFASNSKLRWVKMTDSVEEVGSGAFEECNNLTDIRLSDSIRELGSRCFWNCPKLKSITLPASIEKIDHSTFTEAAITTIICPSGLTEFDLRRKNFTNSQIDNLPFGKGTFYVPEVDADSFLAGYAAGLRWDYQPIGLEANGLIIRVGEKYPLRLKGGAKAKWKTSNPKIATVGSMGDVYAKKAGKVTITATIYGKEYPCSVSVVKNTDGALTKQPDTPPSPTNAPVKPVLAGGAIPLDEEYFPDANFREFLSYCVDANHDGILSQDERDFLTSIRNTDEQPEMIEYEDEDFGSDDPRFWPRYYLDRVLSFQGTEYFPHLKEFVIMNLYGGRATGELFLTGDDLEIFMTNCNFKAVHIEKQEKLQHFYMDTADNTELIDLSGTKNLISLKFSDAINVDFALLVKNEKLRTVYLSANKMALDDFNYLGQMPNVEHLEVWGNTKYPVDLIDLSADTKLERFDFYPDQLLKLILPSRDVQISLSCELVYPEIVYSSDHSFGGDKVSLSK